jgi:hypothetical protein
MERDQLRAAAFLNDWKDAALTLGKMSKPSLFQQTIFVGEKEGECNDGK